MSYYNKNVNNKVCLIYEEGIPGSSAGKESACNVRDVGLIPGFPWEAKLGLVGHYGRY